MCIDTFLKMLELLNFLCLKHRSVPKYQRMSELRGLRTKMLFQVLVNKTKQTKTTTYPSFERSS